MSNPTDMDLNHRLEPGADVIDLRDIAEQAAEIDAVIADGGTIDAAAAAWREAVADLERQLWTDLDAYARNAPVMVSDAHFAAYAEEYADEIGRVSGTAEWPFNHIDWQAAADDLKADYMEVTFGGESYYLRNY